MKNTFKKLFQYIIAEYLPSFPYPVLKGALKGKKIIHGALGGPSGGASVYFDLIEKKQTSIFLEQVQHENVVFDIGANVGYYTILASKIVGNKGKVFSFEPVVRNLTYLYRHIFLNKLENVFILPLACAEKSSLQKFTFGRTIAEGHLLNDDSENLEQSSYTYVPTITIDEFCSLSRISPDIIKMDVEGAELLVLNGAINTLRTSRPKIFLSIHSEQLEATCLAFLKEVGYSTLLVDDKERPSVEYFCC